MKNQLRIERKSGITLIALVITIIILLILSGIVIATITGENGLFTRAKQAKEDYYMSSAKEKLELAISDLIIEKTSRGEDLKKEDLTKINSDEIDVKSTDNFPVEVICQSYQFSIDENFTVTYVGKANETVITYTTEPEGYTKERTILIKIKVSNSNGLQKIQNPNGLVISCNGKKTVGTEYSVNANGTYTFKIIDSNGNETLKDIVIEKIDNINPKIISTSAQNITANSFTIKVEAEDGEETKDSVKSGMERYEYYIKKSTDKEFVRYDSKDKEYIMSAAKQETTYTIYIVAYDKAGNSVQTEKFEVTTLAKVSKLYLISNFEEDGKSIDISKGIEYSTLEEAVDAAQDGNILYFTEGKFEINQNILTAGSYESGLYDKGKNLTFMGENEKSIVKIMNPHGIALANSNSIVRNLYIDYYTAISGYGGNFLDYAVGIKGMIQNCYIYVHNLNTIYASTTYGTKGSYSGTLKNCTLYFGGYVVYGAGVEYYMPNYENIVTNYEIKSRGASESSFNAFTPINILVKDIQGNILNTKNDSDIINAQAGVYFGEYAWK